LLIPRPLIFVAATLTSSVVAQLPSVPTSVFEPTEDIRYISTDLRNVLIFSRQGTRFGDLDALFPGLWPSYRAELVQPEEGVQCVLVGPRERAVELAIKRPIRAGDRYRCQRSSFRVTRCFNDCRAAIVEVEAPASGNNPALGPLRHYMYVDHCLGMLAYSVVGNIESGFPLGAMWLRGRVGVLADPRDPSCDTEEAQRGG
jgi:hypothetical protein